MFIYVIDLLEINCYIRFRKKGRKNQKLHFPPAIEKVDELLTREKRGKVVSKYSDGKASEDIERD